MTSVLVPAGELQGCGGLLNATDGRFGTIDASGNRRYEPNLDCAWQILVPDDKVVTLTFQTFDLESGSLSCDYDYVEVVSSRFFLNVDVQSPPRLCPGPTSSTGLLRTPLSC